MKELPRNEVQEILSAAKNPALFLSFGKDSLLLQHLAREVCPNITLYTFNDSLSSFAEQFIIEQDLTVFRYAPADRYLVPNGEGLALVEEFALNDTRIPLVHPIVKGDNCRHGRYQKSTPQFRFGHDLVLWGYKRGESCDAVGVDFPQEMVIGNSKFYAPLYHFTDFDVYEALEALEIVYVDEDSDEEFCDDCLNAVISSEWDRGAALHNFKSRFGFFEIFRVK